MGGRRWTEEENEFVLENIGKMSYEKIGKKISRSETAVNNKISNMRNLKHVDKQTAKNWLNEYLPIMTPESSKKHIMKKLKVDEKKAGELYKRWRKNYVNRIA